MESAIIFIGLLVAIMPLVWLLNTYFAIVGTHDEAKKMTEELARIRELLEKPEQGAARATRTADTAGDQVPANNAAEQPARGYGARMSRPASRGIDIGGRDESRDG